MHYELWPRPPDTKYLRFLKFWGTCFES